GGVGGVGQYLCRVRAAPGLPAPVHPGVGGHYCGRCGDRGCPVPGAGAGGAGAAGGRHRGGGGPGPVGAGDPRTVVTGGLAVGPEAAPPLARTGLDRAAERRTDPAWLEQAWARAHVLVVSPAGRTLCRSAGDDSEELV